MTNTFTPLDSLASFSFLAKPPPRVVPKNATAVVRLPPATALDPAGHLFVRRSSSGLNTRRPCPCPRVQQPNRSRCRSSRCLCGHGGGIKALALRNAKVIVVGIVGWLL
jgi:hypothetical protein